MLNVKRLLLLFLILLVVNFITIHYFLHEQSTIMSVLVISLTNGTIGFIFSRDNNSSKDK